MQLKQLFEAFERAAKCASLDEREDFVESVCYQRYIAAYYCMPNKLFTLQFASCDSGQVLEGLCEFARLHCKSNRVQNSMMPRLRNLAKLVADGNDPSGECARKIKCPADVAEIVKRWRGMKDFVKQLAVHHRSVRWNTDYGNKEEDMLRCARMCRRVQYEDKRQHYVQAIIDMMPPCADDIDREGKCALDDLCIYAFQSCPDRNGFSWYRKGGPRSQGWEEVGDGVVRDLFRDGVTGAMDGGALGIILDNARPIRAVSDEEKKESKSGAKKYQVYCLAMQVADVLEERKANPDMEMQQLQYYVGCAENGVDERWFGGGESSHKSHVLRCAYGQRDCFASLQQQLMEWMVAYVWLRGGKKMDTTAGLIVVCECDGKDQMLDMQSKLIHDMKLKDMNFGMNARDEVRNQKLVQQQQAAKEPTEAKTKSKPRSKAKAAHGSRK